MHKKQTVLEKWEQKHPIIPLNIFLLSIHIYLDDKYVGTVKSHDLNCIKRHELGYSFRFTEK